MCGKEVLSLVDPHRVAGEEREVHQENGPATSRLRHLEGDRIGAGKRQHAGNGGGRSRQRKGVEIGVPEGTAAKHPLPVFRAEIRLHPEIPNGPETQRGEEKERSQEEQKLPNEQRQRSESTRLNSSH